jgi:predicted nucleotidyltransferase
MTAKCPKCGVPLSEVYIVSEKYKACAPITAGIYTPIDKEKNGGFSIECTNGCDITYYVIVIGETVYLGGDIVDDEEGENIHL